MGCKLCSEDDHSSSSNKSLKFGKHIRDIIPIVTTSKVFSEFEKRRYQKYSKVVEVLRHA